MIFLNIVLIILFLLNYFNNSSGSKTSRASLYDVLGLDSKANENEVKKAYRKLAMKVIYYITVILCNKLLTALYELIEPKVSPG